MADTPKANARWYPTIHEAGGEAQHNVHRQVLDKVYGLQDQLDALSKGASTSKSAPASPSTGPGSPSHTTITGIPVQAVTPKDGQTLKFVAKTGQLEWS